VIGFFCQGQILEISNYPELFNILQNMYGGDGIATFGIPDLRGRVTLGSGTGNGLTTRNLSQQGGEESCVLLIDQMPNHSHIFNAVDNQGSSSRPANNILASSTSGNIYAEGPPNVAMGEMISNTGGNMAVDNMPPYLVLNYIICINPAGCDGTCDSTARSLPVNGSCNNSTYLVNTSIVANNVFISVNVVVLGNLNISNTLTINSGSIITASNCACIEGDLNVIFNTTPSVNNITILEAPCILCNISSIKFIIIHPDEENCKDIKITEQYTSNSILLLLNIENCGDNNIAKIVVPAVIGGIILGTIFIIGVICIIVYYIRVKRRKKQKSHRFAFDQITK